MPAHPRAGGENLSEDDSGFWRLGSSPRGRGKQRLGEREHGGNRLIPVRAGKTPLRPRIGVRQGAHPRAGGENPTRPKVTCSLSGSSPRGRGKRAISQISSEHTGLIPARAGKTFGGWWLVLARRAHPRAGGENDDYEVIIDKGEGSSPRGRGKHT